MPNLTCPVPANINPLQANGFMFSINKLPTLSYFCQEANIPSLDLPSPEMATPLVNSPIPGEKLTFGDLSIMFLIDENMANYIAIHNWMIGLGFPKSHEQYRSFINNQTNFPGGTNITELMRGYSDGNLQVLNSANNSIQTIVFRDLFPVSLQSLQLQSTTSDTIYLAGNAIFKYTLYEFT